MKKLWFDLTNTPHVNFLKPFIRHYSRSHEVIISARDFSETIELAKKELDTEPIVVGKHCGKSKIKKVYNLFNRLVKINKIIPSFDIVLTCGGTEPSIIAKMRGKKAISFDDNDISPNWMYSRFVDYAFFPEAVPREKLLKQGFKSSSIIRYKGYKEDVYISEYKPDEKFPETLPFREYVVVRPENLMANYINKKVHSIVPELLRCLVENKYNVLYLPRYEEDKTYANGIEKVYIPEAPVNGLDACFFSKTVLSGAGTFTREAACLGKPAVSFYAGKKILAVDQKMIAEKRVFHSRIPEEIISYINNNLNRKADFKSSKSVKNEILSELDKII